MQPARAGLAWMQPNFEVLHKVSACVDDRNLKIMAEFDLGELIFEVLRKVSACVDDRHLKIMTDFDLGEPNFKVFGQSECLR